MDEDELQPGLNDSAPADVNAWEDDDEGQYTEGNPEDVQGQGNEGEPQIEGQAASLAVAEQTEVTETAYAPVPYQPIAGMTEQQNEEIEELLSSNPAEAVRRVADFQARQLLAPILHAQGQQHLVQLARDRPALMKAQGAQLSQVVTQMAQVGSVDINAAISVVAYQEAQRTGKNVLDVLEGFAASDKPQARQQAQQARPQLTPQQRAPQASSGTQTARDPQRRARTPEAIVAERHGLTPAELTMLQSDEILQANRRR